MGSIAPICACGHVGAESPSNVVEATVDDAIEVDASPPDSAVLADATSDAACGAVDVPDAIVPLGSERIDPDERNT